MSRLWVVNASPLITMARARRLDLLLNLCPQPVIPQSVAEEIVCGPPSDAARLWLESEGAGFIGKNVQVDSRVARWDLGGGESQVLSHALLLRGSEAILDDRTARNCGLAVGIPVRGAVGIVILAKREGLIQRAAPAFDDLIAAGLRLDAATHGHALRLAGKTS